MSNIYLDRVEASTLLKVSTRTLDRYLRRYKIKTKKNGRNVLIRRSDVDQIINDHIGRFMDDFERIKGQNTEAVYDDNNLQSNASIRGPEINVKNIQLESIKLKEKEEEIYKNLYHETKQELKEKQDRLEAATYRVGQLETQLKNMVPMLDYNRKDKELHEMEMAINQRALETKETLEKTEQKLRSERVAKWVYLALVGLLLIAEPVLFLMWAFS